MRPEVKSLLELRQRLVGEEIAAENLRREKTVAVEAITLAIDLLEREETTGHASIRQEDMAAPSFLEGCGGEPLGRDDAPQPQSIEQQGKGELPEGFTAWAWSAALSTPDINPNQYVQVYQRGGSVQEDFAGDLCWEPAEKPVRKQVISAEDFDSDSDIIAYRIIGPQQDDAASADQPEQADAIIDASDISRISRADVPPAVETFRSGDGRRLFANIGGETREVVDDEPGQPAPVFSEKHLESRE
jgi:hypothetical protein